VLVDGSGLAGQADALPHLVRFGPNVDPRDLDQAFVRLEQGREDAHGRRLPGAVGAQQPQDRPLRDHQVEAVERDDLAVALDEPLRSDHVAHSLTLLRHGRPLLRLRDGFRRYLGGGASFDVT
jgi:hypothetical protein